MPQVRAPHRILTGHLARRRASHSYGYVLLMIGATFFFTATAPDDAWAASTLVLLQTVTLCVALWTSGLARAGSLLNIAFVGVAVVVAVVGLFRTGSTASGLLALLAGVLTIAVVLVLALSIIDQGEINAQSITGAICIYILLGMIFLFIYGTAAAFGHGAFFAQGTDGTRALRLYFSYVTLATLGYGDYTPAGNFGHAVAIVEALFGQLYLVTVVAVLVSRMRPRRGGVLDE
jgi:Ion channel